MEQSLASSAGLPCSSSAASRRKKGGLVHDAFSQSTPRPFAELFLPSAFSNLLLPYHIKRQPPLVSVLPILHLLTSNTTTFVAQFPHSLGNNSNSQNSHHFSWIVINFYSLPTCCFTKPTRTIIMRTTVSSLATVALGAGTAIAGVTNLQPRASSLPTISVKGNGESREPPSFGK